MFRLGHNSIQEIKSKITALAGEKKNPDEVLSVQRMALNLMLGVSCQKKNQTLQSEALVMVHFEQ